MSTNLHLALRVGPKTLAGVSLYQTPSAISTSILPSRQGQGLEPYLSKYIAWVKSNDTFVTPNTAALEATIAALIAQDADEEEILNYKDELAASKVSPAAQHIASLKSEIEFLEKENPGGVWVWSAY